MDNQEANVEGIPPESFTGDKAQEQIIPAVEKLFLSSHKGAIFSEPVVAGEYTVITAGTVLTAGGFGSGKGFGPSPATPTRDGSPSAEAAGPAGGVGGGGGGVSIGRPVAVIVIGPNGVEIKPIIDITRLLLASLATWKAVSMILAKFTRKPSRR